MGFFGQMEQKFDQFRQGQMERRKKNLKHLKESAMMSSEEAKYHAMINAAKAQKTQAINNRLNAFTNAVMGTPAPRQQMSHPGKKQRQKAPKIIILR